MKANSVVILLLAIVLVAVCARAHADVPANVKVLSCVSGSGSTYAVVAPTAAVSMNVSPNASGNPSLCGLPAAFAQTYFVKTTVDGGKTWQWTYHLSDFGYPTANTPPPTPPVTPPVTCANTFVNVQYTCSVSADGKLATCTAPLQ